MPEWLWTVVGPVFIGTVCLWSLGMGLWLLFDAVRFRWFAVRAVGKVVRIHSQVEEITRSNDSGSWTQRLPVHYPVIAFEDQGGVKHEVRANFGNICTPGYQVGESVSILVPKDNPQAMRINSFMSLYWNLTCVFCGTAGGTMVLAFWLFYLWR